MQKYIASMTMALLLPIYGQVIACDQLVPNEKENLRIQAIYRQEPIKITIDEQKERSMKVNYEVKGNDVYIECMIDSFTFAKENVGKMHKDGEGHIVLYVDNQKIDKIFQRAFIVKGLPSGSHTIKVELVRNDQQTYGLEEEITVEIP